MGRLSLRSKVRPKFLWGSIILFLIGVSGTFYLLKEKEEALRIFTQRQWTLVRKNLIETAEAKKKVEGELTAEKSKSEMLKIELSQKKREMQYTLNKLEKEIVARHKAEDQLVLVMNEKNTLEERLKDLVRGPKVVELEKIVVSPMAGIAGKVLKVNKEHKFIVADLGRKNNLEIGDVLSVHRDDEFIGKTKVEKVQEGICAAAILSDWQAAEFKENDLVKLWK